VLDQKQETKETKKVVEDVSVIKRGIAQAQRKMWEENVSITVRPAAPVVKPIAIPHTEVQPGIAHRVSKIYEANDLQVKVEREFQKDLKARRSLQIPASSPRAKLLKEENTLKLKTSSSDNVSPRIEAPIVDKKIIPTMEHKEISDLKITGVVREKSKVYGTSQSPRPDETNNANSNANSTNTTPLNTPRGEDSPLLKKEQIVNDASVTPGAECCCTIS